MDFQRGRFAHKFLPCIALLQVFWKGVSAALGPDPVLLHEEADEEYWVSHGRTTDDRSVGKRRSGNGWEGGWGGERWPCSRF